MDPLEEENVAELATGATEDLTLRRRKLVEVVVAEGEAESLLDPRNPLGPASACVGVLEASMLKERSTLGDK